MQNAWFSYRPHRRCHLMLSALRGGTLHRDMGDSPSREPACVVSGILCVTSGRYAAHSVTA